ncbi:MAG TPA: hypothetical protein VHN14_34455 [Kofleriaceae bacterium]|nr:hypothetical protein [Kofleriaceae bacterium]
MVRSGFTITGEAKYMGGFEKKPGGTSLTETASGDQSSPGPGKQTLTEQLPAVAPHDPVAEVKKILGGAASAAHAAQAFDLIKALDAAQQTEVVTKIGATLRGRLAAHLERAAVTGTTEQTALRHCFDATPDAEVTTLCQWAALRFHLKVTKTSDSTGAAWDKVGLRRCWDVLQMLPAAHVENNKDLSSLTRYRSSSIEGWASDQGEAAIGYGPKNHLDTDLEVGAFTDAKDPLRGKNIFDATVRHEIGHRVDASVGGPNYTKSDDGGGWETWDGSAGMAQRLVTASGGKISSWPDAAEKHAIIGALQHVIDQRAPATINAKLEALSFLSHHATDAAQKAKLDTIKGDDAVAALRVAFSDSGPWDLPTGGVKLGDRIYQESYDWPQWVSYKQSARAKKFSRYQFRAPGEWFAEAYATYYQPPGTKGALMAGLDDKTKAWFDTHVDPQHGAGGTTPAAGGAAAGGAAATPTSKPSTPASGAGGG